MCKINNPNKKGFKETFMYSFFLSNCHGIEKTLFFPLFGLQVLYSASPISANNIRLAESACLLDCNINFSLILHVISR